MPINGVQQDGVTSKPAYRYPDRYLGEARPIKIAMIGAGVTGIAAVKLYKDMLSDSGVEFVIYEKNEDITGTWLENRYPGCACDVPAHAYTYSWGGNPRWSRAYVGAKELYDYFKLRASQYGVDEFVRLSHLVTSAIWNDGSGKWDLEIKDLKNNQTIRDEAEIFINGAGFLNNWKWPNIAGLQDFRGKLLHSAKWDDQYDFQDKNIVIIGSGSSAIQIVPQLQPVVKHMTSINRSKTWITPEFAAEFAPEGRSAFFSEIQKDKWERDPQELLEYRKAIESSMNNFFPMQYKKSEMQITMMENFTKTMRERLGNNQELIDKLVPTFEVGCRRITPGHGYLEALASHNVTVKTDSITEATSEGLKLSDGSVLAVDAIICATGFDTSYKPSFPLVAFDKDLRDVWKDEPKSYFSIAASGFPNYFIMSGPNFPLANGCLIPCLENNIRYAFTVARKLQYDEIKCMFPKAQAVNEYQEYKDALMEDLVWTGSCSSWYKNGKQDGKVWGPWSGSSLHYLETMANPRWEDYNIQYRSQNRYDFLGNGRTKREMKGGDLAYYVSEPGINSSRASEFDVAAADYTTD